ncbi:MAG: beta-galactosidase [Victivallales bacterium]|nr:beta-galactosidase [Victivallales bacterium]
MKITNTAFALCVFLAFFCFANNFDGLKQSDAKRKDTLIADGWSITGDLGLPYGWYIGKFGADKPEYRSLHEDGRGNCIFIRGGFTVDATMVKQEANHEFVVMEFNARAEEKGASIVFFAWLMDKKGKNLGQRGYSLPIGQEWKKHTLKLKMPERPTDITTKITPGFYSLKGIFVDDVTFRSASKDEFAIPPVPQKQNALMDFDFSGIAGQKEYADRTGNYTLYSDCGNLVSQHDALRVAQGARLRIPCKNDAFGDSFTISAWIDKASLGGIFHTPILSRGWQRPGNSLSPVKDEFDFAFYVDIRLPGFATGNGNGGLQTKGHYYNMNISYLQPEYLLIDSNKPLQLNRWQQVTGVYDKGAVKMFLNGKLIGQNTQRTNEKLLKSGLDMYLGAFRCKDERDNKVSAEMLIKSLRIEGRALSDEEIASDFEREKKILPFDDVYPDLASIRDYFPEDMMELDQEMKNRLRQTAAYMEKLPQDPVKGKSNISTRLEASPQGVRLFIDDNAVTKVNGHGHVQDNDHRLSEFVSDFAAAGIDLSGSGVALNSCWLGIGKYDWKTIEKRLELYIKSNPRTMIDVTIGTSPPDWYRKQFPEEQEVYLYKGKNGWERRVWTGHGSFLGSDKYLADSSKMVRDIISHIEKSPYAAHIYGYLVSGGDAGEWYWPGQFSGGCTGYSTPTRNTFRNWLRKKYNNDINLLRSAWNSPELTFDTVEIPAPELRYGSEKLLFRDPAKIVPALDMRLYMQDRNIMTVNTIMKGAREAAPGKQITTYYGYSLHYLGNPLLAFSGLQTVSDILRSPYIDWIATPIDYYRRRGGEPGVNISGFIGSSSLHGKGIWREEDLRTHLFPRMSSGRTGSLRETNEVIRRAYAYTIADDYGMWYICQFGLHGYHTNGIMEDSARMKKIADRAAANPGVNIAEVALVFDEKESVNYLSARDNDLFLDSCGFYLYRAAHSMGAPFKLYLMDDLDNPRMPDYKLYVFMNPWAISAEQREMIHKKLRRNQATAYWCYAPGYIKDKAFSLENMRELTGFDFSVEQEQKKLDVKFLPGMPFAQVPELTSPAVGPIFSVKKQAGTQIIGKNGEYNLAAIRKCDGFNSVWSLLPPNREMLTALCDFANVHVFTRSNTLLLANDKYIALHSAGTEPIKVQLMKKAKVSDMISGKVLGTLDAFVFKPDYKGQTAIYELR